MISVRLPDGRTINVQTSDPQAAAKAARVMLAREALAKQPKAPNTYLGNMSDAAANAMTLGLANRVSELIPAAATGVGNLVKRATGQQPQFTAADMYDAARMADNAKARSFASSHPVSATTAGILGGLATPGGKQVGQFVTNGSKVMAGAKGLLPTLARGASTTARSAAVGGLLGGVSGGLNADPGQELNGAAQGAKSGAITGAIVPAASAGVGYVLDKAVAPAVNTALRALNKATGGGMLDANRVAASRLAEALKADGLDAAQIQAGLNDWLKNGVTPSLLDIASQNGGGQVTRSLLRGAAMKPGPARNIAAMNQDRLTGNLQDNAIDLARKLTPDTRPAVQVADALKQAQSATAASDYAPAYATPVQLDDGIHLALSGQPGQQAIALARKAAVANQDANQVLELDRLKAALDVGAQAPPISAGALDRVRINLGNLGKGFSERANTRNIAPGYFARANQIDSFLSQVPELQPARAAYRDFQGQREALDLGQGGLSAHPDELSAGLAQLQDMSPAGAKPAAGIGYRDAIVKQIGAPPEGATGVLNRLSTSTNQGRNLAEVYGPDAAERFQGGVGQLADQVRNARKINPETGSDTGARLADALVDPVRMPKLGPVQIALELANKVRRGATLTDEERQALLTLGTQPANPGAISALPLKPAVPSGALTAGMALALPNYAGANQ